MENNKNNIKERIMIEMFNICQYYVLDCIEFKKEPNLKEYFSRYLEEVQKKHENYKITGKDYVFINNFSTQVLDYVERTKQFEESKGSPN